eukprot:IDg4905t1
MNSEAFQGKLQVQVVGTNAQFHSAADVPISRRRSIGWLAGWRARYKQSDWLIGCHAYHIVPAVPELLADPKRSSGTLARFTSSGEVTRDNITTQEMETPPLLQHASPIASQANATCNYIDAATDSVQSGLSTDDASQPSLLRGLLGFFG